MHMIKSIHFVFLVAVSIAISKTSLAQVIKGTYAIKNVQTGMPLRIKDANKKDGTPLVAYNPVNWKCMTWDFKHVNGQVYQLQNLFTGKTFQSSNAAAPANTVLEQKPLQENESAQQYEFIPVAKDMYLIKLKDKELYLTPADDKGSTNSAIILAEKKDSRLQQWTIYEQHPQI
jgi:hypothetical protein